MTTPPAFAIPKALEAAAHSPCHKSRTLALTAHTWLAARKDTKRRAEVDLRELLSVLLRDGKLPRDVVPRDELLYSFYEVKSP